jgi:hypothetical protein
MDDDCVAYADWLAELEAPFLKDPRLGAVGGQVRPVEGPGGMVAAFYEYHQLARACQPERSGP